MPGQRHQLHAEIPCHCCDPCSKLVCIATLTSRPELDVVSCPLMLRYARVLLKASKPPAPAKAHETHACLWLVTEAVQGLLGAAKGPPAPPGSPGKGSRVLRSATRRRKADEAPAADSAGATGTSPPAAAHTQQGSQHTPGPFLEASHTPQQFAAAPGRQASEQQAQQASPAGLPHDVASRAVTFFTEQVCPATTSTPKVHLTLGTNAFRIQVAWIDTAANCTKEQQGWDVIKSTQFISVLKNQSLLYRRSRLDKLLLMKSLDFNWCVVCSWRVCASIYSVCRNRVAVLL